MIADLQEYMLTENNIQDWSLKKETNVSNMSNESVLSNLKMNLKTNELKLGNLREAEQKNKLFIPHEQDSLFWCFYIFLYGQSNYEMKQNKNIVITKQLKIDIVEKMRKHKTLIKTYHFDTLTNIEDNLANNPLLNYKTFLSMCLVEDLNIVFVTKYTYINLFMSDSKDVYIVREIIKENNEKKYYKKYGFEKIEKCDVSQNEILNTIENTLYKIELDCINKPIKAVSAYKVGDLISICEKLDIQPYNKETKKRKVKQELYEEIIKKFN
jgi:hypothetical protein